jgi:polysaccharide pyruvyl transferase WcaK-like protein
VVTGEDTRAGAMSGPAILVCSAVQRVGGVTTNLGDEALTAALVAGLRSHLGDADVRFVIHGASVDELPADAIRSRPLRGLAAAIRRSDVVVLGGGTLLQEDQRLRWFAFSAGLPRLLLTVSLMCRLFRRPLVLAAVGAEPARTRRSRLALRVACRTADAVTVRDVGSATIARSLGARDVTLAADTLFLTEPVPAGEQQDLVCVNLNEHASPSLIAATAVALLRNTEATTRIVLVATERRFDRDSLRLTQLAELIRNDRDVAWLGDGSTWEEIGGALRVARVALGMRLHFLLLALLSGAPVAGLGSSRKLLALHDELGIPIAGPASCPDDIVMALQQARALSAADLQVMRRRAWRTVECIAETV